MAAVASLRKASTAAAISPTASILVSRAWAMIGDYTLLEIFVDDFGLAIQIRNMVLDDLDEAGDGPNVLLELFGELLLFLVSPGAFQGRPFGPPAR